MKYFTLIILIIFFLPQETFADSNTIAKRLSGRILLQTENNGEAWYVNPNDLQRYYLGRPADAYNLMRKLGLGITNTDFNNLGSSLKTKLAGKIILKVEDLGKAYYIDPTNLSVNYLGRPSDAFNVMRRLGLGITNVDLDKINIHNKTQQITTYRQDVPFTPQAPFAEWEINMFQDACEEASIIMAMAWVNNKKLTKEFVKTKIKDIANFETINYGGYRDTSAIDTAAIITNYYKYKKIEYKENITLDTIIDEIKKGNIIIAPMNGQILKNIHFNPPGPINHMLVITGYNPIEKKFITNDPGTKRGENYEYSELTLFNALRDYPSGHNKENTENNKNIIIVKK